MTGVHGARLVGLPTPLPPSFLRSTPPAERGEITFQLPPALRGHMVLSPAVAGLLLLSAAAWRKVVGFGGVFPRFDGGSGRA